MLIGQRTRELLSSRDAYGGGVCRADVWLGSNGKIEDEEDGPGQRGTEGGQGALALTKVGSRVR